MQQAILDAIRGLGPGVLVPAGLISGVSDVLKFGRSTNVDSGVETDVWDRANATDDQAVWVAPTVARTHDLVSSDVNDDGSPVGTGARTVKIYGLDSNWAEQSETVLLNGTTNVATASTYLRIYRMVVVTAGSGGTNAGTIKATAQTDTTITAQINIGRGQSQMAIYTVPAGSSAYLTGYYASFNRSSGVAGSVDVALRVREGADNADSLFVVKHLQAVESTGSSYFRHDYYPHYKVLEKSDIKVTGTGSVNNLDVSAGFDIFLRQN